jgi:histidine ammonia-lyase
MIAQFTAASLVSENKVLAHPSSVDSIPTSANQEDHVSMGTIGAVKARNITNNSAVVLAIEFMSAAQAIEMREIDSSPAIMAVISDFRKVVKHLDRDRILYPDIENARKYIENPAIIEIVRKYIELE